MITFHLHNLREFKAE